MPTPRPVTPLPTPQPTIPAILPVRPTNPPTPQPTQATPKATPVPTNQPTPRPTRKATPRPTKEPTPLPTTREPTPQPTNEPTPRPTTPVPTNRPTPAPLPPTQPLFPECEDMARSEALLMAIAPITMDETVLTDPNTPQAQAYVWMLQEDPAQIDPCTYPTPGQRYILATFYFATRGNSWDASNGWLSEDGECIWLGINCNGSGGVTRLELRWNFVGTSLELRENSLGGSLPPEVGKIRFLRRLDVSGNSIEGPLVELPSTLVFLDVEGNSMIFQVELALSQIWRSSGWQTISLKARRSLPKLETWKNCKHCAFTRPSLEGAFRQSWVA
ncbi:leucine Rich Repeat [Seminavis robusta]|uniref:Leucine Rich Repeat n=1 Tax=Seminavis robusta TaxID=568900 RepID=A0A9N8E9J7_9STRA|nr:leucine Rich Repeat [Seminavis robusta]|eukprot:Sro807_g205220.1 leucine Rich Repeat (330) ;mRNA; r:14243-15509